MLRSRAPVFLVGRSMALWATVWMITAILGTLLGRSGRKAHGELGGMRGRRAAGEGAEAGHRTLGKVVGVGVAAVAASLAADGVHLGHLMRLLGVEHHLLVRPLSELGVGGVVIGHLALLRVRRMTVDGIGLLMGILIEGGIELLRRWGPGCLLLLDRVGVRLLLGHGGLSERVVVCRGGALAGYGWVDGVWRGRVHVMISRWMPVLRGKNGHGLRAEGITPGPRLCAGSERGGREDVVGEGEGVDNGDKG